MKKKILLSLFLAVTLLISVFFSGQAGNKIVSAQEIKTEKKIYSQATVDDDFEDNSVLVVMDKNTGGINKRHSEGFFGNLPKGSVEDLTYMDGDIDSRKYLDKENFRQILQIKLPEHSKENVLNTVKKLEKVEGILWVGPSYYDQPTAQPEAAKGDKYTQQWGLHGNDESDYSIKAESAWNITTGSSNVRVGIIDSGIANHPDLNANVVAGGDFVNFNTTTNKPGPLRGDPTGHGTHIAGIIGGVGSNANGISGVNWKVSLVPLQVYNQNGKIDPAATVRAITWANKDIPILNYSAGGPYSTASTFVAREQAIKNYSGLLVSSS